MDYVQTLAVAKRLAAAKSGSTDCTIKIVLAGNSNTKFLEPGLIVGLAEEGITCRLRHADYGDWPAVAFSSEEAADFWVVWLSTMGLTEGDTRYPELTTSALRQACERLIANGSQVIVILPDYPLSAQDPFGTVAQWYAEASSLIQGALPKGTVAIPAMQLQLAQGMDSWTASRYWTTAKCPCHPDAATNLARVVATCVARILAPRVKGVIVDLDNTLWGGVVGDDGPEKLELDPHAEGRPFLAMQAFLKHVQETGVPLAVVSKNELQAAERPFRERPEMILKLSDFVYFSASWREKAVAIREILSAWNLDSSSVCFLDDSPHERAEARQLVSGLIVPELSDDPEERVGELLSSRLFWKPVASTEDRERPQYYLLEKSRTEAETAFTSRDDFLQSLSMRLEPIAVKKDELSRVISLLHKTNQFNVTNARLGAGAVTDLLATGRVYAYSFRLVDRFGDAGIISVLIAVQEPQNRMRIVEWVLSCRVFNRGVEHAIIEHFRKWCLENNAQDISVTRKITTKNGLTASVLASTGLKLVSNEGDLEDYDGVLTEPMKHYIAIAEPSDSIVSV